MSRKQTGALKHKWTAFWKGLWARFKKTRLGALAVRYPAPFIAGGVILLAGLAALIAALCLGGGAELPEPTPSPEPEPTATAAPTPRPTPSPEPKTAEFPNPLTGLELGSRELMTLRPISVMHNNNRGAMPLLGVSQADILYETLIEGGYTRIMGLYQNIDDVPLLGAVRSARTCYLETSLAYDAVLVHCGASYLAEKEFKKWKFDHIDGMALPEKYFWRDKDRRAAGYSLEHTLVSNGGLCRELFNQQERTEREEAHIAAGPQFTLEPDLPGGAPARDVTVTFSGIKTTGFAYRPDAGLYAVHQYGEAMKDGAPGGAPVEVTNLIVIQTGISEIGNKQGHMAIDLQSGGGGWYATGGRVIPIRWSRDGLRAPFAYTRQDGSPLRLACGRSYVCIVPMGRLPEFEAQPEA